MENDKESSSDTKLRTNSFQEERYDRRLSPEHICEKNLRKNICNSNDIRQDQRSKHIFLKLIMFHEE